MTNDQRFAVAVFCGFTPPEDKRDYYLDLARNFGRMLAAADMHCVNGGAGGLMKAVAEGAFRAGGQVTCVCLADYLPDHSFYHHVESYKTLTPRQGRLLELGDAYVALPGGTGTDMEINDVFERKKLGEISRDSLLLTVGNEEFLSLKERHVDLYNRRFSRESPYALMKYLPDTDTAMELLKAAQLKFLEAQERSLQIHLPLPAPRVDSRT